MPALNPDQRFLKALKIRPDEDVKEPTPQPVVDMATFLKERASKDEAVSQANSLRASVEAWCAEAGELHNSRQVWRAIAIAFILAYIFEFYLLVKR